MAASRSPAPRSPAPRLPDPRADVPAGAARPYVVGLTGGIGSGKSTAAGLFVQQGAALVDTDAIAREMTAAGGAAMPAIVAAFGPDAAAPDGALARAWMREQAFSDAGARTRLEAILHPMIRSEAAARLAQVRAPYALVDIPLLAERGGFRDWIDRVLVVDCSLDRQVARVMQRSGLTREQVMAIIAAQATREQRLALADDVLDNDGEEIALPPQVEALHGNYLRLARADRPTAARQAPEV